MAIEPSEAKVTVVAQMITTVDVFDAEILSELQDWQGLGQLIDVSFLSTPKIPLILTRMCRNVSSFQTLAEAKAVIASRLLQICFRNTRTVRSRVSEGR
jgi:hypothetical protein